MERDELIHQLRALYDATAHSPDREISAAAGVIASLTAALYVRRSPALLLHVSSFCESELARCAAPRN